MLIDIVFRSANWNRFSDIFCHQLTLKKHQTKVCSTPVFSRYNWTSTGKLKIDQSRKLGQRESRQTYIADIHLVQSYQMNKKQNMLKVKKKDNVDWRHSSVFFVNFGHISHHFLLLLLLTLNTLTPTGNKIVSK